LVWPPEYQPVQKIIVHHTVTANQDPDPAATVRAIYYYHAVVLGWGDIGYNLLIDEHGNVYEGRFGGVGVIGAHAKDFNSGTVGIALLGAFDAQYVSMAAERALAGIVAGTYGNLAPFGVSLFNNVMLPTISGHRDCVSTTCPGAFAYQQLPNMRDSVARALGQPRPQVQLTDFQIKPLTLDGRTLQVSITVWNNAAATIASQGPEPGFVYREGQNTATIGHLGQYNAWRVGVDLLDNATGNILPYRWGLGGALPPGQTRTITGVIQLNGPKSSWAWAGLVQEGVAYRVNQFGVSRVLTSGAGLRHVYAPMGVRNQRIAGG
ncbi:MAG: peptidoglycan recognition protein family protein, partial [Dehalococcoidia bacterium]|nr:peptidoglycan recognition protein family protein [Dehalococcoidia bacterium]